MGIGEMITVESSTVSGLIEYQLSMSADMWREGIV